MNFTKTSDWNVTVNESSSEDYVLDAWVQPVLVFLYCLSFSVSVGGNFLIFCVVVSMTVKSVTNIFIGSLCLLDIVVTFVCVPITLVSNLILYYWPLHPYFCPVSQFLQVSTIVQRALTLVVMTFDQHYVVWRPLGKRMKKSSAKLIILCIWTLSAVTAIPTVIHSKVIYLPKEPGSNGLCTETWEGDPDSQQKYSITLLVLQYGFPLFVMTLSYIHIGYIIWFKEIPGEKNSKRDRRLAKAKRKTVTMLLTVVISYALCWLPLHVLTLIGDQKPSIFNNKYVHLCWLFSHWVATSNSGLNPVIYVCRSTQYRTGIKLLVCCAKYKNSQLLIFSKYQKKHKGVEIQLSRLSKSDNVDYITTASERNMNFE